MKVTSIQSFGMLVKNPKLLHDDIVKDFGHIEDWTQIGTSYLEDIQCFKVYDKNSGRSVTYPVEQYI